jgi:uncharacterized Zn finger protein
MLKSKGFKPFILSAKKMTETITFKVQGSSIYQVDFIKTDDKLKAHCTCMAGQHFRICKHRVRLMNSISDDVISDNLDKIEVVKNWVDDSRFPAMLEYLDGKEKEKQLLVKEIKAVKKDIARCMYLG